MNIKTIAGITYTELRRDSFGTTPHVGVLFNVGADYHSGWIPVALWDSVAPDATPTMSPSPKSVITIVPD